MAPIPIASTGMPGAAPAAAAPPAAPAAGAAPTPGAQAVPPSQANPTTFTSAPAGGFAQDVGNSFMRIAQFAQGKMNEVQTNINSLFNSTGGQVDAAKLGYFNQQMSTYELMMEQAAKLQQKQEEAARAWIRA